MCKWYCTSNGPSTNLTCLNCGCKYCGACLNGEAGKMKSLIKCAKCNKNPKTKPNGERSAWAGGGASVEQDRGADPSGLGLRPGVDKPNRSPTNADGTKRSIFDKLTDTKLYTGAHKARFDKEGKGRGLDGRDSLATGKGTHTGGTALHSKAKPAEVGGGASGEAEPAAAAGGEEAAPAPAKAAQSAGAPEDAKSAPAEPEAAVKKAGSKPALAMGSKKVAGQKMECPTCGFKWARPPGEEDKPCPKCHKSLPKSMTQKASSPVSRPAVTKPKVASSPPKPKPAPAAAPADAAPAAAESAAAADAPAPAAAKASPSKPASKPALSMGTKKKFEGIKMECPTCGFKWSRPPGEDNKPCPKCLKALPKSAQGGIKSPSGSSGAARSPVSGKPSIFDKLTDPKQYTGAHKERFDKDGKGKGIAGRY